VAKIVAFILRIRRLQKLQNYQPSDIIAMDETAVWSDMVSNSTVNQIGAREVSVRSTGHEKSRVSVCLTAKADGTKLKPFIVFKEKGANRDIEAMKKEPEFKNKCVLATSSNAWMAAETPTQYVNEVIGSLSLRRRLFVWDTYACHLLKNIKTTLKKKRVDTEYVPGGCTAYVQTADVSWNKPFKADCTEQYDEWMANEGLTNLTQMGNLRAPPRRDVVRWILKAWEKLQPEIIVKSFSVCGHTTAVDGSQDHEISCFKENRSCHAGLAILKSQQADVDTPEGNPFVPTDEDIESACPPELLIDRDVDDDAILDIEN
jgi:hypothetical protein